MIPTISTIKCTTVSTYRCVIYEKGISQIVVRYRTIHIYGTSMPISCCVVYESASKKSVICMAISQIDGTSIICSIIYKITVWKCGIGIHKRDSSIRMICEITILNKNSGYISIVVYFIKPLHTLAVIDKTAIIDITINPFSCRRICYVNTASNVIHK